jgi:hypothetical protein
MRKNPKFNFILVIFLALLLDSCARTFNLTTPSTLESEWIQNDVLNEIRLRDELPPPPPSADFTEPLE